MRLLKPVKARLTVPCWYDEKPLSTGLFKNVQMQGAQETNREAYNLKVTRIDIRRAMRFAAQHSRWMFFNNLNVLLNQVLPQRPRKSTPVKFRQNACCFRFTCSDDPVQAAVGVGFHHLHNFFNIYSRRAVKHRR